MSVLTVVVVAGISAVAYADKSVASFKYEEEIRMWATLQDEEGGLYFRDFDNTIRPVEVIIGAKSTIPRSTIMGALGPLASEVEVTIARAAYDKFEIVGDEK